MRLRGKRSSELLDRASVRLGETAARRSFFLFDEDQEMTFGGLPICTGRLNLPMSASGQSGVRNGSDASAAGKILSAAYCSSMIAFASTIRPSDIMRALSSIETSNTRCPAFADCRCWLIRQAHRDEARVAFFDWGQSFEIFSIFLAVVDSSSASGRAVLRQGVVGRPATASIRSSRL